jgi:hypothetical protein
MERSTTMARHSRLYSSIPFKELEDPPVRCRVELEVERPDDVRGDRAHGADGDADATQRALSLAVGHTQALFTPQAVDALVVDRPAGISCCTCCPPPAPAGTRSREVTQEGPKGELVIAR